MDRSYLLHAASGVPALNQLLGTYYRFSAGAGQFCEVDFGLACHGACVQFKCLPVEEGTKTITRSTAPHQTTDASSIKVRHDFETEKRQ